MPLGTLPRLYTAHVHGINLLERTTLRLADKEINEDSTSKAHGRKDVAVPEVDRTSDEWRKEGDEKVP